MELSNLNIRNGLCISLGSNIDSKFGTPINSLIESKFRIQTIISNLINVFIGFPNLLTIFDPNERHKPFLILRFDNSTINCNFIG